MNTLEKRPTRTARSFILHDFEPGDQVHIRIEAASVTKGEYYQNLFLAAPDMLEALKHILERYADMDGVGAKAIAKAEGK